MKYIIDLPDTCQWVQWINLSTDDGHAYFGFKSPEDLTPLDEELSEAYQRGLEEGKKQAKVQAHLDVCHDIDKVAHGNYQKGLDDAWECAKRLVWETSLNEAKSMGFIAKEESAEILRDYTVTAAMKAVELYDEKWKREIKVGDEVEAYSGKAIVFRRFTDDKGEDVCSYWYPDENRINRDRTSTLEKTGRHFPQVAELFKAIKGERSCSSCEYSNDPDGVRCRDCCGYNKWQPKEGAE